MDATVMVQSILDKANRTALGLEADFENERNARLSQIERELESWRNKQIANAKAQAETVINRKVTAANIESRKIILKAKQDFIERVFNEAMRKIITSADNIYRGFIERLIVKNCNDDDKVLICKADVRRLTSDWLKAINEKNKLKLVLITDDFHYASGGVILIGSVCDKNLTIEEMFAKIKPVAEATIAERLFN